MSRATVKPIVRWGLLWRSNNRLDGETRCLICENFLPVIFATREEARHFAKARYGYIAGRPDLRREPHGWRIPTPVRVSIGLAT